MKASKSLSNIRLLNLNFSEVYKNCSIVVHIINIYEYIYISCNVHLTFHNVFCLSLATSNQIGCVIIFLIFFEKKNLSVK